VRKPQDKVIGGVTYFVTPLGAFDGLKLGLKLKDCMGDFSKMDESLVVPAMNQLAKCTEYETGEVDNRGNKLRPRLSDTFDEHFVGKYQDMIEWFVFALSVNFKDFTVALPSLLERLGVGGNASKKAAE
jgi:hypothetical protein